ncbi:hypothetical protein BJ138DRAFT_1121597 [Hygrophoropsis aurantiaca]|uniref:Uncharacterized protein n=1 Tax=Hygrophoropsis aurantiaca TaxID=72124 RepID=A0ACB8AT80_9AGAM|nr:hypothetical protein BJ138DRAFT_1121597 [Hygrophoropsis aurantiaca]
MVRTANRALPKAYQILIKTHQLTIFLTVPQSATIASLKDEVLSALSSDVNEIEDLPPVSSSEEFELCRAVKDKERASVQYATMNGSLPVKGVLSNWEVVYLQFRDEAGNLLPVEVSQPSLLDDDEEEPKSRAQTMSSIDSPAGKGKRKAPPE